jgi:hypothetical protein
MRSSFCGYIPISVATDMRSGYGDTSDKSTRPNSGWRTAESDRQHSIGLSGLSITRVPSYPILKLECEARWRFRTGEHQHVLAYSVFSMPSG